MMRPSPAVPIGLIVGGIILAYVGWAMGYGAAVCSGEVAPGQGTCVHLLQPMWLVVGTLGILCLGLGATYPIWKARLARP